MSGDNSNNTEKSRPRRIAAGAQAVARPGQDVREIDLRDLMGTAREIALIHNGERYRLRITAGGKLILTK